MLAATPPRGADEAPIPVPPPARSERLPFTGPDGRAPGKQAAIALLRERLAHLEGALAPGRLRTLSLGLPAVERALPWGGLPRGFLHKKAPDERLRENAVEGRVEAVEYQGTFVKVTLSGSTAEEFLVNEPESAFFAAPVERADPVVASWDVESVHLLDEDRAEGGSGQPYAEAAA